jgi:DNA invertase Pin-like site-specific DNA recombinase
LEISAKIQEIGAELICTEQQIDTTAPMGRFFFTVLSGIAELEKQLLNEPKQVTAAAKRANNLDWLGHLSLE